VITEIHLQGVLGKKFGKVWKLDVATPHEAGRALARIAPGFADWARTRAFRVRCGKRRVTRETLDFPANGNMIIITPHYGGAGGKGVQIGEIILGVVLILADVFIFHTGQLGFLGASLILGGIAGLLTSTPNLSSQTNPNLHKASYQFSGPVNTIAQGQPVPICYGDMICGSAVVSAGIFAQDITTGSTGGTRTGFSNQGISSSASPLIVDRQPI